jgi:hypothetical protein
MKKRVFVFLLNFLFACISYGKEVDPETARTVGLRFLQSGAGRNVSPDKNSLQLIYTAKKQLAGKSGHQRSYFYVFNHRNSAGFLIIAADDNVFPVLAYSNEQPFDASALPAHVAAWLKGYEQEIEYAATHTIKPPPSVKESWRILQNDIPRNSISVSGASVKPLIHTKWNQSPFYNAYTPGESMTGCVATSMAQVMKYWNHPLRGSGAHQYTHERYGRLATNFEVSGYEWNSMPDSIDRPNHAIAALMYDCGISVEMDYSPVTSNAYLIAAASPASAEHALKKYFGYSNDIKGIKLEDDNYAAWLSIIKSELNAKRPVLYAGFGKGGGHCFIADGYDENEYFHFNWGWGGAFDGYFLLTAVNPAGVGIGGGTGGYNNGHQALIGIAPEVNLPPVEDAELIFYESPALKNASINYADAFSISAKVFNKTVTDFYGDYCAAVFDKNNLFFDYVEIKSGNHLKGGSENNQLLNFRNSGLPLMLPGTYYIGFFYRSTGGKWKPLADVNSTFPLLALEVGKSNGIELSSDLRKRSDKPFVNGEEVLLSVNIVNKSDSSFTGEYKLALYHFDGRTAAVIATIDEKAGLPAGATYPDPLLFAHNGLNVEPGSYLLAISYRENESNTWKFAGGGLFQNPVKVVVEAGALKPDRYEYNNTAAKARALPVMFLHNKAVIKTDSANIHNDSDEDYYRVDLPAGFNYKVAGKLNDRYHNTNGKSYSLDAVFTVSEDTVDWSAPYDEQLDTMAVKRGSSIYFRVSPYFPGERGDYLLHIEITRTTAPADAGDVLNEIKVYPNPVKSDLFINLEEYKGKLKWLELHTLNGTSVYRIKAVGSSTQLRIPVATLPAGVYILTMQSEQGRSSQKIIVCK